MAEVEKQEKQKTVVSFVVGLLIGGLLVWAFSGPSENPDKDRAEETNTEEVSETTETDPADEPTETTSTNTEAPRPVLPVGDGRIDVSDQAAGNRVALASAVYPISEGWVGVRDYQSGQLAGLLGVVRFSEEQGLVPAEIILQRPTIAGSEYAVVVYRENGDREFNLAEDVQLDSVFSTFTAQ